MQAMLLTSSPSLKPYLFYFLVLFFLCSFFRESFPNDLQFNILMRFTVDQTQTPSLKVKILFFSETITRNCSILLIKIG